MKRHETLIPFSREHHEALILAQLLKKTGHVYNGLPADTAGKIKYAMNFYNKDLLDHMAGEEKLFEEIRHKTVIVALVADDIVAEHTVLKYCFSNLQKAEDKEAALRKLGRLIELHVRKEERILFPMIETHCIATLENNLNLPA